MMQCPTDATTLVRIDRLGVDISYCPTCRGSWLDPGVLDTIISRAEASATRGMPAESSARGNFDWRNMLGGGRGGHHGGDRGHR